MNHKSYEFLTSFAQSVIRRAALKRFGLAGGRLAPLMLIWCLMASVAHAQTSTVCDPTGDASFSRGNGSPVPAWLEIRQAVVFGATGEHIVFILKLNAPVPAVPTWNNGNDGRVFQWGWRLVGDFAKLAGVRSGCLTANGATLPAGYYLDLMYTSETSAFHARLLENPSCTVVDVPFAFSADRTEIALVVAKEWLSNTVLIPDPEDFQYVATTTIWKSRSSENSSFSHLDWAPNLSSAGGFVPGNWSASGDTSYFCP